MCSSRSSQSPRKNHLCPVKCVILKHSRTMALNMSRSDMKIRYQCHTRMESNGMEVWISWPWSLSKQWACRVLLIFHSAVPCYWENMKCELAWIGKAVSSWTVTKQSVDVDLSSNLSYRSCLINTFSRQFPSPSTSSTRLRSRSKQSRLATLRVVVRGSSGTTPAHRFLRSSKAGPLPSVGRCGEIGPSLVPLPSDPR